MQNLVAGFDPTGQLNIAGEDLKAMVELSQPYADIGLLKITSDVAGVPTVPDGNGTAILQQYMWVRKLATSVIAYLWNAAAANDPTYQRWQAVNVVSIAPGSITNIDLAPGSVTNDKIVSVDWSKLTSVPSTFTPGGAAGGDLTGTYPNPVVGANKIDSTKLSSDAAVDANRAVTNNHIKDGVINPVTKLIAPAPSALAFVRTKSDSSGWEYQTVRVLQTLMKACAPTTAPAAAGSVMNLTSAPTYAQGVSIGTLAITPTIASSYLRVRFRGFFACKPDAGEQPTVILALFDNTAHTLIQATAYQGEVNGTETSFELSVDAIIASASTTARTYDIRFGVLSATDAAYFNRNRTGTWFGDTINSWLQIDEIQGTLS